MDDVAKYKQSYELPRTELCAIYGTSNLTRQSLKERYGS
jgi:hypothetical protein